LLRTEINPNFEKIKLMRKTYLIMLMIVFISACSDKTDSERNGFTVNDSSPEEGIANITGIQSDTMNFRSRPNGILLTSDPQNILVPIYKLNARVRSEDTIYSTGGNSFHYSYSSYGTSKGNNWNYNYMPGFGAMFGHNLINIQYHNTLSKKTTKFFKNPVLINTLYYPTDSKDTLNGKAVQRDYYMVSAYNEDTNRDGYINTDDLRRFFLFNLDGTMNMQLIPDGYSVNSSQYDPYNDYMYVYAAVDENVNGYQDDIEDVHVFWIDLKSPQKGARLY
jgi:hypothetical protein